MTEAVVDQRRTVAAEGFANPLNLPANAEHASHVKVYGDNVLLALGVDYTLDGVGDTGNLDEIDGVDVNIETDVLEADLYATFTVEHLPPAEQDTDLASGGTLGRLFMAGLDALARLIQSLNQNFIQRSLRLPVDVTDTDVVLPLPEHRRGLVWEQDQDTGDYRLVNTAEDPDTEPLTSALAAQVAAELAETNAEAAAAVAQAQAQAASDSADRAEDAAAEAGDLSALLNFLWPTGAIMSFAGAAAPANFLACDGAAISRTTYSALFAVIGTTYGAGNGTTTFNLPDFRGLFLRGAGGSAPYAAASQGAVQADMVGPHDHTASLSNDGAHTHTYGPVNGRYGANDNPQNTFRPSSGDSSGSSVGLTTSSNGAHTHTATINNNSGTETRPRNTSVLYCIKT
jgi:microcystin-dependent protein